MNSLNFFTKDLPFLSSNNLKYFSGLSMPDFCNFFSVSLIILAFILSYNSSLVFGFNFSLYSLFIGMFGLIVINLGVVKLQYKHYGLFFIFLLILILMMFFGMLKWLDNAGNNVNELIKSSFFYLICLL